MTGVTPRYFFLNPYLYPSTLYLYGEGMGLSWKCKGIYIKPTVCKGVCKIVGFFSKGYKPDHATTKYKRALHILLGYSSYHIIKDHETTTCP